MEELQKLYDVLVREGKYTKTFDEFKSKWSQDEAYKNQVFDVVSRDGLYTKDKNSFFQKYSTQAPAQEEVVAPVQSKKKFALDSSSEVGSSELQEPPKKKTSVPTDMSGTPIFKPEAEKTVKPILQKIQKENQQIASEKKKYGDIFDKQLNINPKVEESKYLKDRLATVNTELINREEEYVVPELEYQFGDLGFKFEESGATGDYVKVTAPNGKTTEISLDNFLSSKSKTQSDLLQNFIKQNTPAKGLFVLEKTMREQDKKFNSQKQVDDSIKVISDEVNNLNAKQKQFLVKKGQFEKQLKDLGPNADPQAVALLEQQRVALNDEMKLILQEENNIKQKGKKLDAAVGKYSISKAKQGTWLGGIRDAFFGGVGKITSGITSVITDITAEVAPMSFLMSGEDATKYAIEGAEKMGLNVPKDRSQASINKFKQSLTEDQLDEIESYVRDQSKKDVKKEMLPLMRIGAKEILGDPNTTQQWEDLKKQDFWGGAILGLSESLPAMVGGAGPAGWAQRTAAMYAQVSDGLAQEMEQDPDFKDISENEKLAITLPIGIVGAVLENIGLRNIKGSQGVINSIALKALGKAGKGVTAKSFRELVENEVDGMLSKGLLTITAAGAAEFETGAAQELADTGFKALYNEIKGKEMFDTPDSTADLIENVVVSGAQEAVGGFVLGVPSSISTAYSQKGFLKMDDTSFETFANMANDDKMQSAFVTNLKEKITRGEVTTKDAKDQLNNYRNSVGLFRQLPDGLSTQQKKEAMNLLKEKKDLENYVEGKDNALVVKQKNRIAEINDSLTKLSETEVTEEKVPFEMLQDDESAKLKIQAAEELKQEALSKGIKEDEINISEKEINNKAKENYAIQEQSTTEIPVQSETGISETVAEGISEPKPEVVTEQGTQEEVTAPQTIIEEQPDVVKVKKSDDFINDAEQVVSLNGEEAGRMYYDRSSKAWRDPNFDKSKYSPESFERIYGDILGDTKQEATDELIRRRKESMKQEAPIEETIAEETVAEEPQAVQFSKDTILNNFLNKLNSLNPLQKNPIDNKSFVYGDKASLEFNRFDKGDKNEVSLEGITSLDKGKGLGKEAMTDITKSADELGTTLTLDAKPFGREGLGKKELIEFYKKNGFEVDKQYLEDLDFGSEQEAIDYVLENESEALPMVREPKISEPQAVSEVNDLLELDTKDQTSLQRVLDYLDSLDSSLDLDPNELNDVTRVMAIGTAKAVVKTLKALVKAGITLQEAINTAAEIHSVESKDVLKAFDVINQGGKQKSAPSPLRSDIYAGDGRIISVVKDVKKITMREKDLLVKQIKDKAKGAKDVINVQKELAKELAAEIKELSAKGKITLTQAANIVSKFSKVNLLNEASVSNFVDYMSKVFADAEYDNKVNVAKSKLKTAKKNIVTKLGIADGLILPLQRLFSINPNLIPEQYLDRYLELVDMFSARQQVLTLEEKSVVTKDVQDMLDEINNEQSLSDELADRFEASENKVFKDGVLDYSASVKNMLDKGEIDSNEATLMSKYKNRIVESVDKTKMTDEEIQQEKDVLESLIKKSDIDSSGLSTRDEINLAKRLGKLIKGDAIKELSNTDMKNVLKLVDNINNGYLPHYTQLMVEKLTSVNNAKSLESAVNKSKFPTFSYLYSKAKSVLTKKDTVLEMIRRNPLFYIDQVLGNFKTKDIFNSILEMAAEAESKFTSEFKSVKEKLTKAQNNVAKSLSYNPNKVLESSFKIMTYAIQLEYDSNIGNKQVNPAADFIKATIKHINDGKSQFGERDAEMLQKILDNFTDSEGNIDSKKLFESFNKAEKNAIKTVREINESLTEKSEYTASIIRGQKLNPLTNYIHLNVLHEHQPNDLASGTSFADNYNNSLRPSTKAKSLIERTGKVSPLNFDIFSSAERGSKFVLMDYHLTEPIRTARKTINRTISNLEKDGNISKKDRSVINAINNAFEESVDNLITNTYVASSIADDVVDEVSRQGYRGVLAGTGRFGAELLSNVGFILLSDPSTFTEGLKNRSIIMSSDAPKIMNNVNSKETNRIFPSDMLSGRLVDTSILSQSIGTKGAVSKNDFVNRVQQIWNLTGKKYKNAVELTADALISTPDKIVMRPIWFGSFATNFEKLTGKKVDFKKIADNDSDYMEEYQDAIDASKNIADERSVITGASSNAFTGLLKGASKPNQSATIKGFNNFNNFMSRFLIYEYITARTGIYAAMGNGSLTRKQGVALLAAVTTRMTVYSLLMKAFGSGLIGLLFDDEDEEEEKSADKMVGQALASTFTSLLLGRDFGNLTKGFINFGVEKMNEEYLDFLRDGEYDPYKDAIQYSVITPDDKQKDISNFILKMGGSFGPVLSTANLALKKSFEPEKKEEGAIERQEKEISTRIPLEIAGNLGFIPLYKDIRRTVLKDMYKGLVKEKAQEKINAEEKQKEKDKLRGYKNKTEMKENNPRLYKETFPEETKSSFGKQSFGSKEFGSSKSKSSGFGSKKFGAD